MEYRYSKLLSREMDRQDVTIPNLAARIGRTPEHVRKLVNSQAFPSNTLSDLIAEVLNIDKKELDELINHDRWEAKHGKLPTGAAFAEFGPLQNIWPKLTGEQQEQIVCIARCYLKFKKSR